MRQRVDARLVYRAWYAAAGPWAGYFRAAPLIGLARGVLRLRPDAAMAEATGATALAAEMATVGDAVGWLGRPDVLLVLDLPGAESVLAARALAPRGVRPVLVLPQWPAPRATVPCGPLLAALSTPPDCPATSCQYAFVLARERIRTVLPATLHEQLDTRYELGPADLPEARRLRAAGIQALVVCRWAALPWPDDLVAYTMVLCGEGLIVHDLALPSARVPG